jgi:hypothetical protein
MFLGYLAKFQHDLTIESKIMGKKIMHQNELEQNNRSQSETYPYYLNVLLY